MASEQFSSIVDLFSELARLTTGILLQSELIRDSEQFNAIASELLEIGDRKLLDAFASFQSTTVSGELDALWNEFTSVLKKKPQDVRDVGKAIQAITGMVPDIEKLKAGVATDGLDKLKNSFETAVSSSIYFKTLQVQSWNSTSSSLTYVLTVSVDSKNFELITEIANYLKTIRDSGIRFSNTFPGVLVSDALDNIVALKDHLKTLEGLKTIATIGQKISEIQGVESVATSLTDLKTDVKNLGKVLQKSRETTNGDVISTITQKIVDSMKLESKKSLTVGLPNGLDDINKIFEDLNGKRLKDNIADGESTETMSTALQPLNGFLEKMKGFKSNWDMLIQNPVSIQSVHTLATQLASLKSSSAKVPDPSQLESSIGDVAGCLKDLKSITFSDGKDFDSAYDQLSTFISNAEKLRKIVDDLKNSPSYATVSSLVKSLVGKIPKKMDTLAVEEAVKNIKAVPSVEAAQKLVNDTLAQLNSLPLSEMELFLDTPFEWKPFEEAKKSLEESNLVNALTCIAGKSFDSEGVESFVRFSDDVQSLSAEVKVVDEAKMLFRSISSVTSSAAAVKAHMIQSTRQKRGTDGNEIQALQKLDRTVVQHLSAGVVVLQKLKRVLEKQKTVNALADLPTEVNTAVLKIPIESWTPESRKMMKQLVEGVKELDGFSRNLTDLESKWKVLTEASFIKGAPIDTKLFADPIAKKLESDSDPKVKAAAAVFREAASLQLDFARSSTDLKAASLTLGPLTTFFDEFFEINRTSKLVTVTVAAGLSVMEIIGIIAGCVVFVVLIVLTILASVRGWWRCFKKDKKRAAEKVEGRDDVEGGQENGGGKEENVNEGRKEEKVNEERKEENVNEGKKEEKVNEERKEENVNEERKEEKVKEGKKEENVNEERKEENIKEENKEERKEENIKKEKKEENEEIKTENKKRKDRIVNAKNCYRYALLHVAYEDEKAKRPINHRLAMSIINRNVNELRGYLTIGVFLNGILIGIEHAQYRIPAGYTRSGHLTVSRYDSSPEILEMLIKAGYDLELKDSEGYTVLDRVNKLLEGDFTGPSQKVMYDNLRACRRVIIYYQEHGLPSPHEWKTQPRFLDYRTYTFNTALFTNYYKISDIKLSEFRKKFNGSRSASTHIIVPVDGRNVFDLDKLDPSFLLLYFAESLTSPAVLISHRFIDACLADESNVTKDLEYMVKTVRFGGKEYEKVDALKHFVNNIDAFLTGMQFYVFGNEDLKKIILSLHGSVFEGKINENYIADSFSNFAPTGPSPSFLEFECRCMIIYSNDKLKVSAVKYVKELSEANHPHKVAAVSAASFIKSIFRNLPDIKLIVPKGFKRENMPAPCETQLDPDANFRIFNQAEQKKDDEQWELDEKPAMVAPAMTRASAKTIEDELNDPGRMMDLEDWKKKGDEVEVYRNKKKVMSLVKVEKKESAGGEVDTPKDDKKEPMKVQKKKNGGAKVGTNKNKMKLPPPVKIKKKKSAEATADTPKDDKKQPMKVEKKKNAGTAAGKEKKE